MMRTVLTLLILTGSALAHADWKVSTSTDYHVVVDTDTPVRSAFKVHDFTGLNLNYFAFQRALWDRKSKRVKGDTTALLKRWLPDARYRFPGGMVSNGFSWRGSLGPVTSRVSHRNFYGKDAAVPTFGLEEYLDFTDAVSGRHWYVLNLVGSTPADPLREAPIKDVAQSNRELVEWLNADRRYSATEHYYQLGNELDRSQFEWPHAKYVERARANIDAIRAVDKDARFVAFLRGFKYRYRKSAVGTASTPDALFRDVLSGLPEVTDLSLMQYYDGKRDDGKAWSVPFWLHKIDRSVRLFREMRDGADPRIWITEHARQASTNRPGSDNSRRVTSNQSAAISTADYIIALTQIPQVNGAFWHGLNAGPWQLFDTSAMHGDLTPRPVFWALANLAATGQSAGVFDTRTASANASGYDGGYDLRATAIERVDGGVSLWLANRHRASIDVRLEIRSFANKTLRASVRSTSLAPQTDPDALPETRIDGLKTTDVSLVFDTSGTSTVTLPASAVVVISVEPGAL